MKTYKNPTTHAIRNVIEPYLSKFGFKRTKPKDFFRVRGDLVDHIYFGFGRWGSKVIYIYCSVHLLANPFDNVNTYSTGIRLDATWYPTSHDDAVRSAGEIIQDIEKYAFEMFNTFDSIYKLEGACANSGFYSAFTAIALGDLDRAKIYLTDALSMRTPLIYDSGYPGWRENEEETDEEVRNHLRTALNAIESNKIEEWKRQLVNTRYAEFGLEEPS